MSGSAIILLIVLGAATLLLAPPLIAGIFLHNRRRHARKMGKRKTRQIEL